MKFAMEADALSVLGRKTSAESDDLGALVRQLSQAAEPLEGTFNGAAKAQFISFKERTDEVAVILNNALVGITESISAQDLAFRTAADEGAEAHRGAEGSADFSAADTSRFAPRA
ncbi:hypothetical protein [Oerskovia merdavium]|uniref:WXG100 family type VII secretion target n=1 Tax=Oerskovia merdavium TaxID=2762227 RepID=A0ABR8U4D0_9CELL|nr:hypothetical protein [Oerskovia merdavium]MBD7982897.1 hypothetical protein [Oerskovia merdavium]